MRLSNSWSQSSSYANSNQTNLCKTVGIRHINHAEVYLWPVSNYFFHQLIPKYWQTTHQSKMRAFFQSLTLKNISTSVYHCITRQTTEYSFFINTHRMPGHCVIEFNCKLHMKRIVCWSFTFLALNNRHVQIWSDLGTSCLHLCQWYPFHQNNSHSHCANTA